MSFSALEEHSDMQASRHDTKKNKKTMAQATSSTLVHHAVPLSLYNPDVCGGKMERLSKLQEVCTGHDPKTSIPGRPCKSRVSNVPTLNLPCERRFAKSRGGEV